MLSCMVWWDWTWWGRGWRKTTEYQSEAVRCSTGQRYSRILLVCTSRQQHLRYLRKFIFAFALRVVCIGGKKQGIWSNNDLQFNSMQRSSPVQQYWDRTGHPTYSSVQCVINLPVHLKNPPQPVFFFCSEAVAEKWENSGTVIFLYLFIYCFSGTYICPISRTRGDRRRGLVFVCRWLQQWPNVEQKVWLKTLIIYCLRVGTRFLSDFATSHHAEGSL